MKNQKAANSWHLYLIETNMGSLYCGVTTDVQRRFKEHSNQGLKCARSLRGKAPLRLVFSSEVSNKSTALRLEYKVKKLNRSQKMQLIDGKIQLDSIR